MLRICKKTTANSHISASVPVTESRLVLPGSTRTFVHDKLWQVQIREEDGGALVASMRNGCSVRAKLVVGADGNRSACRTFVQVATSRPKLSPPSVNGRIHSIETVLLRNVESCYVTVYIIYSKVHLVDVVAWN